MVDPLKLLIELAKKKSIGSKWIDMPLYQIKILDNSCKGDLAEEFVMELCKTLGFNVEPGKSRLGNYDLEIEKKKFEVKMATEDLTGNFQFNHIRYDYKYDWLICIGISPNSILFEIFSKADVVTGKAGNLVSMGKGQNASFKLTKPKKSLKPILEFNDKLRPLLKETMQASKQAPKDYQKISSYIKN